MIKKICNHCGKVYIGYQCECRKKKKKTNLYHNSFYDSPAWRSLSRQIRIRDFYQDRIKMYFDKFGRPNDAIGSILFSYMNTCSYDKSSLVVHHIITREEDSSLQYNADNLISLSSVMHEFVHGLYVTKKEKTQEFLKKIVNTPLP